MQRRVWTRDRWGEQCRRGCEVDIKMLGYRTCEWDRCRRYADSAGEIRVI